MFRMKNKLNNLYNANREVKFALVGGASLEAESFLALLDFVK